LTPYISIRWFQIYIAQFPHHSLSSSFSPISLMYHKQPSNSRPCAANLSGELCSWMHGLMQRVGCHSSMFGLRIDRSIDESYAITDITLVCIFHHKFRFPFNITVTDKMIYHSVVVNQLEWESRMIGRPVWPLHTHWRIIMSHNLVNEIHK
jgi:hypothetical protein